jgi:hypothetical protein
MSDMLDDQHQILLPNNLKSFWNNLSIKSGNLSNKRLKINTDEFNIFDDSIEIGVGLGDLQQSPVRFIF